MMYQGLLLEFIHLYFNHDFIDFPHKAVKYLFWKLLSCDSFLQQDG